ncbi:MAG: sensor domain-containing diguanylate cyclase [Cellvibrionaceae bacterium]
MAKKSFQYKRNLTIALIILQLLTVSLILIFSRINTEKVLIDKANQLLESTADQSLHHTNSFLEVAYNGSESISKLLSKSIISNADDNTIEALLLGQLLQYSHFAGLYVSTTQGDYTYVLRSNAKANSSYQMKIIKNQANNRSVSYYWRAQNLDIVHLENNIIDPFEPRSRPWYKLAFAKRETIWTKPYTFFTSQKPGISVATPYYSVDGTIKGIFGIDIELTELTTFLDQISAGIDGYVVILDKQNNIIASPFENTEKNTKSILPSITSLTNKNGFNNTPVINNVDYLAHYSSLSSAKSSTNTTPEWTVATFVEKEPFLKEIRAIEKRNIIIGITILSLSILISWIYILHSSKPVEDWMDKATTDFLTQLYNRHHFFNVGKRVHERYQQNAKYNLSIVMIDIDHFKKVNDQYGHGVGDKVLKETAHNIQKQLRPDDIIARFGGEEFILLLPNTDSKTSLDISHRLCTLISQIPIQTKRGNLSVTISLGVNTMMHNPSLNFTDFIETADKALYQAKNSGRNQAIHANISS